MPLPTARYFVFVSEPPLELHDLALITIWLETLSTCSCDDFLLVQDLGKKNAFVSPVLLRGLGIKRGEKALALSFKISILIWTAVNSLLEIICSSLGSAWISCEMHGN